VGAVRFSQPSDPGEADGGCKNGVKTCNSSTFARLFLEWRLLLTFA
jgi:hypothetical protein